MLKKVIFSFGFLGSTLLFAQGAKFLVVEDALFNKIETLNILNGGIKKDHIIKSTKLSDDDMKKYYSEYFLYDATECNKINKIVVVKDSNYPKQNMGKLTSENEKLDEIKSLKLLQILNDYGKNFTTSKVSTEIVESVGVICDNKLLFRGQNFAENSMLNEIKIKKIDEANGIIYVEKN